MPEMPLQSFDAGLAFKVPILIGSNLEEDKFFSMMNPKTYKVDEEGLRQNVSKYVVASDVDKLIRAYRIARAKREEPTTPFEVLSAINTDFMFRKTAIKIAEAQCKFAVGGYNYLFTWKSPAAGGLLGACHVIEIGFVFGNYNPTLNGSGPGADKLSKEMQDAWVSFARTGNPGCQRLGEWPKYSSGRSTMVFGRTSRLERAVYEEERQIWEELNELKYSNML